MMKLAIIIIISRACKETIKVVINRKSLVSRDTIEIMGVAINRIIQISIRCKASKLKAQTEALTLPLLLTLVLRSEQIKRELQISISKEQSSLVISNTTSIK
jgi:hypothetical protein